MAFDFQQGILEKLELGTLEELKPEDGFQFSCGQECMGRCCQKITILLDPWDIEVMARHLGISNREFFSDYCMMEIDTSTGWPAVWLAHAAEGHCAFMLEDGKCSIYPARSRNCRTYPLGRAVRYIQDNGQKIKEERVFMVDRMKFCLGHKDGQNWTVQEWFDDADAYTYYRMSDQYTELVDYAVTELNSREWMSPKVVQMIIPFLFAPDMLRDKLGLRVEEIGHEEFHRRRMKAVKLILTDMAAGLGYGPGIETAETAFTGSLMDRMKKVLTTGD
ncbi:Putative zinc-or iron-chelating domain-containing protein [Desulfotomaculum arcticum]|uniref:Putative zinc-or iron-chelating domain-containing protein n=1 Tax=Desulfotruncus arcticus DSM 17038 TaxID=1121424 RepID=A0A1I2TR85_9FIRM|nr:YkgJ family cysteine cluster protein [Desulfotruncus arcticus]SFG64841.1 Putative zinc-or iron-chelating domain-containing protein [Desulfotomaculum arcticum] [Desulfotruncus arcticus DSM 17038]